MRNASRRLTAMVAVGLAALSLVFDPPRLLSLSGLFTAEAKAQPRPGGGGPRMGGGPGFGGGPRIGGGPRPGGPGFGGPPMGARPSIRPPAPMPMPGPMPGRGAIRPPAPVPGFVPGPGPRPPAFGPGPRPIGPGPVPPVVGPGPRPPFPGPGPRPPFPGPVPGPRPWVGPRVGPGPWLWVLPAAAAAIIAGGVTYYRVSGVCYIERYVGDQIVYVPVEGPCPPGTPLP